MSIHLSIYVGPYFAVSGITDDLIFDHETVVTDGRGQAGVGEEVRYLIPNCNLPGCDRNMRFGHTYDPVVVNCDNSVLEKILFENLADDFLSHVDALGGEFETRWGVVCGIF